MLHGSSNSAARAVIRYNQSTFDLAKFVKANRRPQRLYSRERIDPLPRINFCVVEDCLGVTPIEGIGRFGRVSRRARKLHLVGRFRSGAITMMETLKLSLDALRAHKLRSFLTLLGVILAVTTLVAVMSVVDGLNFYVADKVANLGANVYVLTALASSPATTSGTRHKSAPSSPWKSSTGSSRRCIPQARSPL